MLEGGVIIKAESITKSFGGIHALTNVDFELKKGEVHGLIGENGAGKSTLGKIIAGIEKADTGTICYKGQPVNFTEPKQAINAGISIVLQEFNLLKDLSVAENIFLNHKEMYQGNFIINKKQIIARTDELLDLFEMKGQINPLYKISELSVAEMQIIEILKAVSTNAEVILLDEPTATLSVNEVERLFRIIRQLKSGGVSFVIVSHRLNELFQISDRITVLRDGKLVMDGEMTERLDEDTLVRAMVGREIKNLYYMEQKGRQGEGRAVLQVQDMTDARGFVRDVSFEVFKGEIVGISGLVGSGRTELVRCIFGVDRRSRGKVSVDGKELVRKTTKEAIANGISMVPEDRKNDGLLLEMSIACNIAMVKQGAGRKAYIDTKSQARDANRMVEDLKIKIGGISNAVKTLSGGNQQKVLLAKWLLMDPRVLIIDEPTRGIDISAKSEIYAILNRITQSGVAVLIVSSELPEIIGICDRVLVMSDGRMVKELKREELSEELILSYASKNNGRFQNE